MAKLYLRPGAFMVLLAFAMFLLGAAFDKYKFFPYELIRATMTRGAHSFQDPNAVLARQFSNDADNVGQDRDIDTALLPLKAKGLRVSEYFPIAKVGGGVASVGDRVIIMDRLGNIYSCDSSGDNLIKLPFPALPNNVADYLAQPGAAVDDKKFRAYSIRYLESAKLLAVAHEYFDKQINKSRLAVSIIGIDKDLLQPIGAWKIIFLGDAEPQGPNEQGAGQLAAREPDKIYLSIGDYGIETPMVAQDMHSRMGKILEIDLNNRAVKMVSFGHRNPEGLTMTTGGTLLSTEHGPAGGDELNLIVEGANYGWPIVTLGTDYGSYRSHGTQFVGGHTGYQAPLFAWIPSIAVSSLIQVQGFDQRWDGDLLIASLKAQSLFRLRIENKSVLYSEPIWIGQRIRDIAQLRNGTIVLWTDDTELKFLSVDRQRLEGDKRNPATTSATLVTHCMYCHHFGPTNTNDFAPSLTNVLGRKIGSDNFRYSAALRTKEGVWTEESLRDWLLAPGKFASGTAMPDLHLSRDELEEVLVDLKANTRSLPERPH